MAHKYDVTTARPKVTGAVYRAAVGTALPETASADLDGGFVCLGYVSQDGLEVSSSLEREITLSWGGRAVLDTPTGREDTFKLTLIEAKTPRVRQTVFGTGNVSEITGGSVTRIRAEMPRFAWVVDMILAGGVLKRIVIPRGSVREVGDITYRDAELVAYALTIRATRTEGVYYREYLLGAEEEEGTIWPEAGDYHRSSYEAVLAELYARDAAGRMSVPAMTGSYEFQRWMQTNGVGGAADYEAGGYSSIFEHIARGAENTVAMRERATPPVSFWSSSSRSERFARQDGSTSPLSCKISMSQGSMSVAWTLADVPADTTQTETLEDDGQYHAILCHDSADRGPLGVFGTWRITLGTPTWDTYPNAFRLRPGLRISSFGQIRTVMAGESAVLSLPVADYGGVSPSWTVSVFSHLAGDYMTVGESGTHTYTMTLPCSIELIGLETVGEAAVPSMSVMTRLADQTGMFCLAETTEAISAEDETQLWPLTLADTERGTALGVFGGEDMTMTGAATSCTNGYLAISADVEDRTVEWDGSDFILRSIQVVMELDNFKAYGFDVKNGDKDGGTAQIDRILNIFRRDA